MPDDSKLTSNIFSVKKDYTKFPVFYSRRINRQFMENDLTYSNRLEKFIKTFSFQDQIPNYLINEIDIDIEICKENIYGCFYNFTKSLFTLIQCKNEQRVTANNVIIKSKTVEAL